MAKTEGALRLTEQEIYDAVVRLMSARGYHGTSLRQVAADVGIQMSSLYYYFPTKQAMLIATMTRTMQELIGTARTAIADATDPVAALLAAATSHVVFHADSTKAAFVTDSELRSLEPQNLTTIVKLRDEYQAIFQGILANGRESGDFQFDDLHLTTLALISMLTGVAVWYSPKGSATPEEVARHHVEVFLHGVATRPA